MASETMVTALCMDTAPFDPEIGDRLAEGPPWGSQSESGAFRRCVVGGSLFRRAGTPPPSATATKGVTGTPPYAQLHRLPYRRVRMIGGFEKQRVAKT